MLFSKYLLILKILNNKMRKIAKITSKLTISSLIILILTGCYSFVGGSLPDHLKTLNIEPVIDQSNSGVPEFQTFMYDELIRKFRSDGSLKIDENNYDSRLTVQITSIMEAITQVTPGELEKERKVTVTCKAVFYDNVKKKMIWEKDFTNYSFYSVSDGFVGRNEAIRTSLRNNSEDILLSVISGW